MDLEWKREQQKTYIQQNQREAVLQHRRNEHQQKIANLHQEQRMRLVHATSVDKRKLRTQYQQNQLKIAAKLEESRLAASDRQNQLASANAKYRAQISYQKDAARVQAYHHQMKMEEIYSKRKNMQEAMLASKFNAQQKQLAQGGISRRMIEG